jgi:hypothetical protein
VTERYERRANTAGTAGRTEQAMRDVIEFTKAPVRVTSTTSQDIKDAIEVAPHDQLDALLDVVGVEGSGTITVEILTGMQKDTTDGWVSIGTFTSVNTTNSHEKIQFTSLLRYVRWNIKSYTTFNAVTFQITGMLRRTA